MLHILRWSGSDEPAPTTLNSKFAFQFDKIIQLLEFWPEAQECLLRRVIPSLSLNLSISSLYKSRGVPSIPESLISTLRNIGEGNEVILSFDFYGSITFNVKWSKAFCIIGEVYLKLCEKTPYSSLDIKDSFRNDAYKYFMKASSATDKKSGHLLAQSIPLQENYIPFLEKVAQDFPQSAGTALAMVAIIELEKIPFGASPAHPQVEAFFQTVESAYKKINLNLPSFFSTQGADKRRSILPIPQGREITKVSNFIDWIADKLSEKTIDISIEERFINWTMTVSQYLYTHWVSRITRDYLSKKWGEPFILRGILYQL